MRVGDFAIFRGLPVSIKSINGDDVEIKYCLDLGEDDHLFKNFQTKVKLINLREFNHDSAKELLDRNNYTITNLNLINQAIENCLKYV